MLGDLRSFDLFDLTAGARNSLQRMEFTYILDAPRLTTFRKCLLRLLDEEAPACNVVISQIL
ncbi:hypothetical protein RB213_016078 [Colletotrichum asianum]